MALLSPRNLSRRYLLLVLGLFAAAVTVLGVGFFRRQKAHIRAAARNELQAIADLKVASIARWRQERLGDAQWMLEASNFPSRARDFFARSDDAAQRADLMRWMNGWRRPQLYGRVLLLDRELLVRLAAPAGAEAMEPVTAAAAREAFQERKVTLADLHRDPADGSIAMDLAVPLVVRNGTETTVGVLVFEIDPRDFLFPHIQTWPTPSRTAETLLVRREGDAVVYLNELRHRTGTALSMQLPITEKNVPAVRAVLGERGVVEGEDYRGVPVLSAIEAIPDSPWFIVAKQDLAEIDAPVGQWAWMLGTASVVLIAAGAAGIGFVWRTREIHFTREEMAERSRAGAVLQASKTRLKLALEAAGMGVWHFVIGEDRRQFDARASQMLGIDVAAFNGTAEEFHLRIHPEDRPVIQAALRRTIEQGVTYEVEYRAVWPDGSVHSLASRGQLEHDATGRARLVNGLLWDITARKEAEEAVCRREAELRALYSAMTEMVAMHEIVTDAAGRPVDYRIVDCNPAYERITGIPRARAVGMLASALYGTGTPPYLDVFGRVALIGEPEELETYFPPMGRHFAISIVSPGRGQFATVTTDITEQKNSQMALADLYGELVEAQRIARLGSYRLDVTTGQWTGSALLDEIFGLTDPAFVRDVGGWASLVHPEDRAEMLRHFQEDVLGACRPFSHEYRIIRMNDRAVRWVLGLGELGWDAAGAPLEMIGTIQDITERKQAEVALRESQQRLVLHVEQTPLAVIEWDLSFRATAWNPAAERIFGYTAAEALGRTAPELLVPKEHWGHVEHVWRNLLTGQDGRRSTNENITKDGRTILCDWFNTPLIGASGEVATVASLVLDVTERRRHEEERDLLLHELERKNEDLETMMYVASHDLRAPLVNVQGFGQRLEKACAELVASGSAPAAARSAQERITKALHYIRASADKMNGLIDGLLRISRIGRITVVPTPVDMNRLLREVAATLEIQLQQAAATVMIEPLPPCRGDAALLNQVFANLLDNALKYRAAAGALRVSVTGRTHEGEAIYCVEDTGRGIPAEHQDKIWEMFHRLHPDGPVAGEGIGLKIVRRILDRHHGRIWIESTPGVGSRFFVALPRAGSGEPLTEEQSIPGTAEDSEGAQ